MSVRQILSDMAELLDRQVEHVVHGDYGALEVGAAQHEQLLTALETTRVDVEEAELRVLLERVQARKQKLESLIVAESRRVDFMLRLLLGKGTPRTGGYPGRSLGSESPVGRLNHRA